MTPVPHAPDLRERRKRVSAYERFWSKVNKSAPGDCWLWLGCLSHGYGVFYYMKRKSRAHRWAYEQANGPIPAGLELDHLCRVTACVNPAHLEPVTHAENMRRSTSATAVNTAKSTCPRGHPYDMIKSKGGRWCRQCQIQQNREWYRRNYPPNRSKRSQSWASRNN